MIHIFGASYGIVVATKLLIAGYNVACICKTEEAKLLNDKGFVINIPGYLNRSLEIFSKNLPGKFIAIDPISVEMEQISLAFLAMQESHYEDLDISKILLFIAKNKIPCVSIMNMPPSIYLKKLQIKNYNSTKEFYKNFDMWNCFDSDFFTQCSADPQIYKPYLNKSNLFTVRLASNFRVANFDNIKCAKLICEISSKVKSSRLIFKDKKVRVPINFNIFDSKYIPLGKWPMLITGNYRCFDNLKLKSIKDAVLENIEESRLIYNDVLNLCYLLGANINDLISFEAYLKVINKLDAPSSVARAASSGDKNFERLDKLIQFLANENKIKIHGLKKIVKNFDYN
jgi:hypothetical protein